MASEINRAYHAELRKAKYRNVGHGIKSNAEQVMRNRNPDFLGTKINPVNAGPRLFFSSKDEARIPWEDLINVDFLNRKIAGAGVEPSTTGALATPAGRSYARKQLERKALDLEMIRAQVPMPVEGMAQASAQMDDVQRRQLEVSLMMRQVLDSLGDGSADSFTVENLRRAIPSLVDLVPFLSAPQIMELKYTADDGIEIGRDVPDVDGAALSYRKARDALTVLFRKIGSFLSSVVQSVGEDRDSRRTIARNLATSVFKRDQLESEYALEDIPPQADDAELEAPQLEDDATRPVRRVAPSSSAASAAAAAEPAAAAPGGVDVEKTERFLGSSVKNRNEIAREAFSNAYDEFVQSKNPELRRLVPKGGKRLDSRNMLSMRPFILRYMRETGRYPTESLRNAVARYRR